MFICGVQSLQSILMDFTNLGDNHCLPRPTYPDYPTRGEESYFSTTIVENTSYYINQALSNLNTKKEMTFTTKQSCKVLSV